MAFGKLYCRSEGFAVLFQSGANLSSSRPSIFDVYSKFVTRIRASSFVEVGGELGSCGRNFGAHEEWQSTF